MELDVLILSRLQFALTIMFHYLFPPLSIGLGWIMVIIEALYLKTGNRQYESIARFLTGLFAVVFAMGVATGIVMEFQFGTNWATYSRFVGDVFGSALAAEGIFAFFLESGFLAVLVFGWDRVGKKMHFFSTCMVATGALFSSVWITVANSWQQTPAGFHIVGEGMNARAEITDFWAMVFNPSSIDRLVHVWIGCGLLGAFFVMSISAWYLLHNRHEDAARKMFVPALCVGLVCAFAAPISGHSQARMVAEHQPSKLAAFEGHFETGDGGAPLWLFGVPDVEARTVKFGIAIPGMLSFLVHDSFTKPVPGLDQVPRDEWPPVSIAFQSYHLMVALGLYFMALLGYGAVSVWRGTIWTQRWLLWIFVFSVIGPYVANQAGWVAAEVGRQPWIVWGLLKTPDALSKNVVAEQVLASILLFTVVYLMLFAVWVSVLHSKIQRGPVPHVEPPDHTHAGELLDAAASLGRAKGHSLTRDGDDGGRPS
ncbi:MAG: cytochrome ubiquinol oxidase subunit I [Candidatus Hydrogenedentota bacterium]